MAQGRGPPLALFISLMSTSLETIRLKELLFSTKQVTSPPVAMTVAMRRPSLSNAVERVACQRHMRISAVSWIGVVSV